MPLVSVDEPSRAFLAATRDRRSGSVDPDGSAGPTALRLPRPAVPARERRSVREFADLAIASDAWSDVIRSGLARSETTLGRVSRGVRVLAIAHRVPPSETHPADNLAFLAPDEQLSEALSSAYVPAPGYAVIAGDLSTHGPGHAAALVAAGATGYAIWLEALRRGLSCSVFGGTSALVTRRVRTTHPRHRHLFTVALGFARGAGGSNPPTAG